MPARSIAWIAALTPNTKIEPIHILKTIHHIHAKICITRCLVLVSGMWDSGLCRLSMTRRYSLIILVLRPFWMSDKIRSALRNGISNANIKLINIRDILSIPATTCPYLGVFRWVSRFLASLFILRFFQEAKRRTLLIITRRNCDTTHLEILHLPANLA